MKENKYEVVEVVSEWDGLGYVVSTYSYGIYPESEARELMDNLNHTYGRECYEPIHNEVIFQRYYVMKDCE